MMKHTPTLLAALALAAAPAFAAELRITVRQALPSQGELMVILFDKAQGFPSERSPNQPSMRVKAEGETMKLRMPDVPEGRWAVMVMQDLNGNGRIDYGMLGFPKEPYGASNNKLPKMSAPKFEDALIDVGATGADITIDLRRP